MILNFIFILILLCKSLPAFATEGQGRSTEPLKNQLFESAEMKHKGEFIQSCELEQDRETMKREIEDLLNTGAQLTPEHLKNFLIQQTLSRAEVRLLSLAIDKNKAAFINASVTGTFNFLVAQQVGCNKAEVLVSGFPMLLSDYKALPTDFPLRIQRPHEIEDLEPPSGAITNEFHSPEFKNETTHSITSTESTWWKNKWTWIGAAAVAGALLLSKKQFVIEY